jgi:pimeloyl-ACP methyl ester carboxylesterase
MPEALSALRPDSQVRVEQGRWIVFQPIDGQPETGLIFYPGGRVDARAYAPAMRAVAAQGYLAVIVPMPLNLAVLAPDSAAEVMAAYPQVRHWAIGGHSLGGAMAARYAYSHPGAIDGLVLWASYPAASDDLSGAALRVVSIYGTRDGLATSDKIDASRPLLPPDTQWIAIEGGNHAQFGWYGPQQGDNEAAISRADQQAQAVEATLQLLEEIGQGGG